MRRIEKFIHLTAPDGRRASLKRFRQDEDGVMVMFAVYVFLMMLIVGGIGIDVMRFERDRTRVQYTLDRAVLAAADLDQQLNPQSVVEDYFAKANLSEYLSSVSVDEGLGYRIVSGTAETTFATQFMHMAGVDSLTALGDFDLAAGHESTRGGAGALHERTPIVGLDSAGGF